MGAATNSLLTNMEEFYQQDLWISGEGGYFRYRIPALVTSTKGTVLAFAEARKFTGKDSDQIDISLRRSTDGARTFDDPRIIATKTGWVTGNPSPVVDRATGTIWLLLCRNLQDGDETMICEGNAPREVWIMSSDDDGVSWTEPTEITAEVKPSEWSWYATGPGHGIQLSSERLMIPCDHIVLKDRSRQDPYFSHVVYSDDGGKSWQIGGTADEGTNESTILEAADGRLYFNCRNKYKLPGGGNSRCITWSDDSGDSFSPIVHDAALPEPNCQASVCRLTTGQTHDIDRVLFSNPADRSGRTNLTVRLSYDECRTWPESRVLHESAAAYSDLCVCDDEYICCLYERGDDGPYERITLARFNVEWLTYGRDRIL